MNPDPSSSWPLLVAHFAGGGALGAAHLYGLRWSTARLAAGSPVGTVLLLMAGRFGLLAALLALAAREGAFPLLATALGVVSVRSFALRRARRPAETHR